MDTQERLRTSDALIKRAQELMAEVEQEQDSPARRRDLMFMASTYTELANVILKSVEVRTS